ncbi:MAG: tRNA lysidine(34) synthetase TilS [Streptosporangiaceae bacterium]|nr:tRNA lysidine(34) synthetase TilS [Streptosporangiaceae bacterium]
MGPGAAAAEIRNAVRDCLADLRAGALVLAACSGGADSLAMAAALAFVAPRAGLRAGGVTVDHGLQPGSAERAAGVARLLGTLGLDPVRSVAAAVPGGPGPEAAARNARYLSLETVASRCGAAAVLLGHTLDDQAETVLLGLARGSGGRSLAGMPARRGRYRRPLLGVRRATTSAACAELGLVPWQDPHNSDVRYARARVRHQALPALEAALGPGVAEALARTASQLRSDAEYLDQLAFAESGQLRGDCSDPAGLDGGWLRALPAPIRTRVLREAAVMAGCPPGALAAAHVDRLDALVTSWHGQRWVDLPGGVRARRRDGKVWFTSTEPGPERYARPAGERGPSEATRAAGAGETGRTSAGSLQNAKSPHDTMPGRPEGGESVG